MSQVASSLKIGHHHHPWLKIEDDGRAEQHHFAEFLEALDNQKSPRLLKKGYV
ncbi:hypothetical protein B0T21DRAFT_372265 [Apiosordaria backusii]|uniref:Uncharacterized protein n=1 Tax=Apiosordaria backusii TaxID=314023 RepID=A0AA40AXD5_9PEZI|nr:hypothetical protein B0T21DRAFT_372265 [Apiosordaria backusii]